MNDILMLIRTPSLNNDDRVRKEAITLKKEHKVTIVTFENRHEKLDDYFESVLVCRKSLSLRRFLPNGKFVFLKIMEMYIKFIHKFFQKKPDVVWLHNFESIALVFVFNFINFFKKEKVKIIWDQHELPPNAFLLNKFFMYIYSKSLKNTDERIIATSSRGEYINQKLATDFEFITIENYPDEAFRCKATESLDSNFVKWLNKDSFFLCQGGVRKDRGFEEVVAACIKLKLKVVFIGPYSNALIKKVESVNSNFSSYVYIMNAIPQLKLADYIKAAEASIVFYKKTSMNNWLCAPNRLFQALGLNKPVISGNNPIFKEFSHFSPTYVCETDGSDIDKIIIGINAFLKREDVPDIPCLTWKTQENKILNIESLNVK